MPARSRARRPVGAVTSMPYCGPMTRRTVRITWCLGIVGVLVSLLAPPPVGAQSEERSIEIWLESPPSFVPAIDLRLSQGGTDITDVACGPISTPSEQSFPERQCADLGDGTFAASVTGVPAGAIVSWTCTDIVAAQTEHTSIPLGNGFTVWRCVATVSPPGVVIDGTRSVDDVGNPLDDLELVIEDETGTVVAPPCEDDTRGGLDRQWCGPLPPGTYEAVPQNIPSDLRAAAACTDFPTTIDSFTGPFTIDAANPRWFCEKPVPFEPLAFGIYWTGASGRDLGWIEATEPTLLDANGGDLTSSCTEQQRSIRDGGSPFIEYACTGITPGSYTVSFSGIPAEFETENGCDPVEVPEQPGLEPTFCSVDVTSEPLDVPPPEEPTDPPAEPEPPRLPDTGTPTTTTIFAIGLAALAAGLTLLFAGRRHSLR